MESLILQVDGREGTGTAACRRERRNGRVPAIIYGLDRPPRNLSMSAHDIENIMARGTHVVELVRGENRQVALLKDVQYDPLGQWVVHVDFARIDRDKPVHVYVRVRFIGMAPAVAGSIVEKVREEVHLEVLPLEIPDGFVVNLSGLQVGEHVSISDLPIPENCSLYQCSPDDVVVTNHMKAHQVLAAEEEEGEGAEESAEPEVIGEKKPEGGDS